MFTARLREQLLFDISARVALHLGLLLLLIDGLTNDIDHEPEMSAARLIASLKLTIFDFV